MIKKIFFGLRPADTLNFLFLFFLIILTGFFYQRIADAPALIGLYAALILILIILLSVRTKGKIIRFTYDLIFPVITVLIVFDSLGTLVHSINPSDIDPLLIRLDYLIFNDYPTVIIEKISSPVLTDIMQLAYTSYYFLPITLGIVLLLQKNNSAFDRSLFIIILCFYLSYIGYMLFPALGPRYTMNHLQGEQLRGLIVSQPIKELLNRLEGIKRDAFPSGHTGVALTILYLARRFEKRLFWIFVPVVVALIISTVYCRYHYVVDILAGVILSFIAIYAGERFYEYRSKRVNINS